MTKYDCSSADINPIGSISKVDLKRFIAWAATDFDMPILKDFIEAIPTAELEPITADYVRSRPNPLTPAQLTHVFNRSKATKSTCK